MLNNDDLFRRLVQARANALLRHKVVVSQRTPYRRVGGRRVNRDTHPRFDLHRFILPNQRPLDEIIPLSVGIKPSLGKVSLLLEELVVGFNDISSDSPRASTGSGSAAGPR